MYVIKTQEGNDNKVILKDRHQLLAILSTMTTTTTAMSLNDNGQLTSYVAGYNTNLSNIYRILQRHAWGEWVQRVQMNPTFRPRF